jgi:predicted phage terminase large subunit-like protein
MSATADYSGFTPEVLQRATLRLVARRKAARRDGAALPTDWEGWLAALFPAYVSARFADRHIDFWRWVWAIEPGTRPRPFVAIWPRGGAKSTSAELAAVALGAREKRRYALYISMTQEQADDHVANVAALLESPTIAAHYPALGQRLVGKFGNPKGWRRNRVRAASGFTVDAIGLDTAARGIKLEDARPDLIILDDIDGSHDTLLTTQKKIKTLTHALLPAGATDAATLAVQNLIGPNGVFARLADTRADFLADRIVSGPHPAVAGLQYTFDLDAEGQPQYRITGGEATWAGQSLATCAQQMRDWGYRAFLEEAQHKVDEVEGALWSRDSFKRPPGPLPDMTRVVVAVDPATTSGIDSDETGIVVAGQGSDGRWYILADRTCRLSPDGWARRAVAAYDEFDADRLVAEVNNGGDMVGRTIQTVRLGIPYKAVRATRGKYTRAEPVAALYEQGRVFHADAFPDLEDQLVSWTPESGESPDRLDALVWAMTELAGIGEVTYGSDIWQ